MAGHYAGDPLECFSVRHFRFEKLIFINTSAELCHFNTFYYMQPITFNDSVQNLIYTSISLTHQLETGGWGRGMREQTFLMLLFSFGLLTTWLQYNATWPIIVVGTNISVSIDTNWFKPNFTRKYFLRSFSPFRWFKKGSCQFLAKECAQYWLTA